MKKLNNIKKPNPIKKIFIKICRLLGYEIIDQNIFQTPTLNKSLSDNLSTQGTNSIVLPLGEVKITRKVKSILIILRSCSRINIWNQNKKRIFDAPRSEYTLRSINSLLNSVINAQNKLPKIDFKLEIIDDNSDKKTLEQMHNLLKFSNISYNLSNLNKEEFKSLIKANDMETFANLSSLYKCYLTAKNMGKDLIFFIEDDYLHSINTIEELILTYERISSQINKEIFLCPADYPYLYAQSLQTSVLIGNSMHWQVVKQSLCTFLTSKDMIEKYWENFINTCKKRNDPFEKFIHEIYETEFCLSPIPSLSLHLANINSIYGLSPTVDWEKLWIKNKL